jgi:hypothetical protein
VKDLSLPEQYRPIYKITIKNVEGGDEYEYNSWYYKKDGKTHKSLNKLTIYVDRDLNVPLDLFRIRISANSGKMLTEKNSLGLDADNIKPGAVVKIYLGYAGEKENDVKLDAPENLVLTGLVDDVSQDLKNIVITGYSNAIKIISKKPEAFKDNQCVDADSRAIAMALLGKTTATQKPMIDVDDAFCDKGMTFTRFVPNIKESIYNNIKLLAEYNGFDLYFSREGKLRFGKKNDRGPDINYGEHVLENSVSMTRPPFDEVSVVVTHGEKNADVHAWRITSEPLEGADRIGTAKAEVLQRQSAIIKDEKSAQEAAKNKLARLYVPETGSVTVLGNPKLELGQEFDLDFTDAPDGLMYMDKPKVRITRITHKFNMRSGFKTIVAWARPVQSAKTPAFMGSVKPGQKIGEGFSYGLEKDENFKEAEAPQDFKPKLGRVLGPRGQN